MRRLRRRSPRPIHSLICSTQTPMRDRDMGLDHFWRREVDALARARFGVGSAIPRSEEQDARDADDAALGVGDGRGGTAFPSHPWSQYLAETTTDPDTRLGLGRPGQLDRRRGKVSCQCREECRIGAFRGLDATCRPSCACPGCVCRRDSGGPSSVVGGPPAETVRVRLRVQVSRFPSARPSAREPVGRNLVASPNEEAHAAESSQGDRSNHEAVWPNGCRRGPHRASTRRYARR